MSYKIRKTIRYASIICSILLVLNLALNALAVIIITPEDQFIVGNEIYTVYQTMEFESITISDTYIIFNDTGFYISSVNDISISLVYIDEDFAGASDNDLVLAFYADSSSGSVDFELSGFPVGNEYLINRDGSTIDISTADVSGNISFINNVWDDYLFEIYQWSGSEGDNPPIVGNIPDQTINVGGSFEQIDLDDYVFDYEDPDEDIDWSYSGNDELIVSIVNRVATISVPYSDWEGSETITFTAEDTDGMTDSDDATFKVIANYAPFFSDLSISNGATDVPISTSSLSLRIEDPDGDSFNWAIQTSPNIGSISRNNHYNGTKSCSISGLAYSTTYQWTVSATDGIFWTYATYSFTTEDNPNPPPPPPGGGEPPPPPPNEEQNNSPETPLKPAGPTFVEIGVQYEFSSSTFDVDGDKIKLRFDWGDGNVSEWSEFVDSNTTVSMNHSWSQISTYAVRAIAKDTNGLNSNWSPVLNVSVSQTSTGKHPIVSISIFGNVVGNQTIIFDASDSYDPDGTILSYDWDFGDGEVGSGINASHVFTQPGQYTVTLIVTDNNGSTFSKSIIVNVTSEFEESESGEQRSAPLFNFTLIIFVIIIAVFAFFIIYYRDQVTLFVSSHFVNPILNTIISYRKFKIKRLDSKIFDIYKNLQGIGSGNNISNQLPTVKIGQLYDEIQDNYVKADSEIVLTSEEKKPVGEFDKVYTSDKLDEFFRKDLKMDKLYSRVFDAEERIDRLIATTFDKKPSNLNSAKDGLLFDKKDYNIEKKVDNLFISKKEEKIDR